MRLRGLIYVALNFTSTLVTACGGHGKQVREWSQEELDELEAKWGTDVSLTYLCLRDMSHLCRCLRAIIYPVRAGGDLPHLYAE